MFFSSAQISYSSRVALEKRKKNKKYEKRKTNFVTISHTSSSNNTIQTIRDRVCWSAWTWAIKLIFVSLELRRECCFVVDNDDDGSRAQIVCERKFFCCCCCCCLWSTTSRRRKSTCLCVRVVSLSRVEIFTSWNYFIIIISGRKRRRRKRKGKKWARNVDIRANIGLNERFMVRIFTASSRRRRRRWASGVVAFDHIFREIVNTQPRASANGRVGKRERYREPCLESSVPARDNLSHSSAYDWRLLNPPAHNSQFSVLELAPEEKKNSSEKNNTTLCEEEKQNY